MDEVKKQQIALLLEEVNVLEIKIKSLQDEYNGLLTKLKDMYKGHVDMKIVK